MLITYNELSKEASEIKINADNEEYCKLIFSVSSLAFQLEAHKQSKLEIILSEYEDNSNEYKYNFIDYKIYKVIDSKAAIKRYLYTLIITVEGENKELLSFCYDHIVEVTDDLINTETLKFFIKVRNRVFDCVLTDEEKILINEYRYSTFRIFLIGKPRLI